MFHRYRIQPSSPASVRFTSTLAAPAKNLAKSLDKGWGVEYGARVFILDPVIARQGAHTLVQYQSSQSSFVAIEQHGSFESAQMSLRQHRFVNVQSLPDDVTSVPIGGRVRNTRPVPPPN
jgi:hypothetical protein